ncbi:MAG: sce7726 family protein [Actinomycetota bacterium]
MHEARVRSALRNDSGVASPGPLRIFEEFWIPRTRQRADLVVLNGKMVAFEIKTAADSLRRLPKQVSGYSSIFDLCTLVADERHLEVADQIVPDWWGLWLIDDSHEIPQFSEVRASTPNSRPDPEVLVRLLWRDEAYRVASELGCEPGESACRSTLWQQILSETDTAALAELVRAALHRRDPEAARIESRSARRLQEDLRSA